MFLKGGLYPSWETEQVLLLCPLPPVEKKKKLPTIMKAGASHATSLTPEFGCQHHPPHMVLNKWGQRNPNMTGKGVGLQPHKTCFSLGRTPIHTFEPFLASPPPS